MDFKAYCFLAGEMKGGNRVDEGFKILHGTRILILLKLEGLDEEIHTKHDKRKVLSFT